MINFDPMMFRRLQQIIQPSPTVEDQAPDFSQLQIGQQPNPNPMPAPTLDTQPPEMENMANQRLMSLLNGMPQRTKPGIIDRIGGVAQGIAHGPQAQEDFMYRGYNRNLKDWGTQFQPTLQAAQLERQMNIAKSQQYSNDRRADAADRRAGAYEQNVLSMGKDRERRGDIAERAQELKAAMGKRPDLKWELDENNEYVGFDSKGGPPVKSGIKSNELSDAQKINLGLEAAIKRIQTAGDVRAGLIGFQGEETRRTNAADNADKAKTKANEPLPPAQQKIAYYNTATKILNENPVFKKYIELGVPGTNDFKLKGNPDTDPILKQIRERIYGKAPVGKDSLGIR